MKNLNDVIVPHVILVENVIQVYNKPHTTPSFIFLKVKKRSKMAKSKMAAKVDKNKHIYE